MCKIESSLHLWGLDLSELREAHSAGAATEMFSGHREYHDIDEDKVRRIRILGDSHSKTRCPCVEMGNRRIERLSRSTVTDSSMWQSRDKRTRASLLLESHMVVSLKCSFQTRLRMSNGDS